MGKRSMNALVVNSDQLSSEQINAVLNVLEPGRLCEKDGAIAWVWETNIQPFWSRSGVEDLIEEAVVLKWVLSMPREAYLWTRSGADAGILGEWSANPFVNHDDVRGVLEAYQSDIDFSVDDEQVKDELPVAQGSVLEQVNVRLESAGLPGYTDVISLLNESAKHGLSFDIGTAYIRRAFIDHQSELLNLISGVNKAIAESMAPTANAACAVVNLGS